MKLTYRYEIDHQELLVFDAALTRKQIQSHDSFLDTSEYKRSEQDRRTTTEVKTFVLELDPVRMRKDVLFFSATEAIRTHFPGESQKLWRAYCNLNLYGDMSYSHRDCPPGDRSLTVLFYANACWKQSWAGETMFFNDAGDSVIAVNPKPGRMVVFRGAIEHRTGLVSRECFTGRLTIALKFAAK